MRTPSRSSCRMVDRVHSVSPPIISSISVLARMTARGVFSSWLALVMNCFWRLAASISGATSRLENRFTRKKVMSSPRIPRMREM